MAWSNAIAPDQNNNPMSDYVIKHLYSIHKFANHPLDTAIVTDCDGMRSQKPSNNRITGILQSTGKKLAIAKSFTRRESKLGERVLVQQPI